jgi:GT2 family glycosyltransferase
MTNKYDMTVAISTFNRDDKVAETIAALYASDLSRFERVEVIVVDDGSPRPVADVLAKAGPAPEKMDVRLIRQENSGIGATRNRGFREARSNLVVFLDDDIIVRPSTLNEFVDAHREHPGGVIFGSYPFISHESESLHSFARHLYGYEQITETPNYERVDAITSGLLCIDKSKLREVSELYRNDMTTPAAEEYEIVFRFNKLGVPIYHAHHISALHNHHLELGWLAEQQFKYGLGTAEAFAKCPEIVNIEKFRSQLEILNSADGHGSINKVKSLGASSIGRRMLKAQAKLLGNILPLKYGNLLLGSVSTAYYWAGFKEGKRRFKKSIK